MKIILFTAILMSSVCLLADFNFAQSLFNEGLYEEAISEFEKIIALSPTSEEAEQSLFYIGECYREREEYEDAEKYYKRLWDGYPESTSRAKTLYYIALSQFMQEKHSDSQSNYNLLINKFPSTSYAKNSLTNFLQSIYNLQEYSRVIVTGRKLLKNYEGNSQIPEVLLLMAKAYFANNIPAEGKKFIEKICSEYPHSNSHWQAIELEIDLIEADEGIQVAAKNLAIKLDNSIPRQFEESFRKKLSGYFIELSKYDQAYEQLVIMVEKFNNSIHLDEYLTLLGFCRLRLGKFSEIILITEIPVIFNESPFKAEYMLYKTKAYYYLGHFEEADILINKVMSLTDDDEIIYECELLKANILEKTGRLILAIESYQKLLASYYAPQDLILLKIGDIYLERFQNYIKAIKFYEQVQTLYSSAENHATAAYKIALCYEKLERYDAAVTELAQIELSGIYDLELKNKITKKRNYLKKFKQKDFSTAFENLLNSIYIYLENEDKSKLQEEIITILNEDLKEYEKSIDLIIEDDPQYIYTKAIIYLKIIEKNLVENNFSKAEIYFIKVNELVSSPEISSNREWVLELNIRKNLLEQEKTSIETIIELENFIVEFPESSSYNEFLLVVINYYKNLEDFEKAVEFSELLQIDKNIDNIDYYNTKINLAEYYYQQDNNEKARKNYELAESQINMNIPEILFHFAISLDKTDSHEKAADKFEFLLKNAVNFTGFDLAVNYYTGMLTESEDYEKAVEYLLMIPVQNRDDEFYEKLANVYLTLGVKDKAKESLMYIIEKSVNVLKELAQLQFETNDLEMAKYSYGLLVEKNKNNLENYEMLGRIAFIQESYLGAAENYKIIVDKLGDNFTEFENISQITKENIISLYRIENRPKAEVLQKKLKSVLKESDLNEIKLNEGIYYIKMNAKKAEKIFSNLLKEKELDPILKFKTYFWRGVSRMEQEKIDEAENDFLIVSGTDNKELKNQADLKLGTINFTNEKYQQSLGYYYHVIENDESGELALDATRNFAFVCKTIEEWQKAVAAYEIILERWGDMELESETLFDIAFCHFRDKKYKNAVEMFEKSIPLLQDRETKAEAQFWIGESYFGMEEYEKAVTEFLKVGYNYEEFIQWAASAELRAGESYLKLQNYDKAKRIYERIINKYGKLSQWGEQAKKKLEEMM